MTRAIILAAGRGSRLGKGGDDKPKCLVALGGVPLIERHLAVLRSCGIGDITLVTGYRADMLCGLGVETRHNPDWADTNMVETLFSAADVISGDVIVAYGDIVYEPRVLNALMDAEHDISVVIDKNWRALWEKRFDDPLSDAETLRLDDNGVILEIGNRPGSFDDIDGQYIGLMRFQGEGTDALLQARELLGKTKRPWMEIRPVRKAYMTDLLMEMILTGQRVQAVPVEGGWLEIDTAADVELMQSLHASGQITAFYVPDASDGAIER